MNPTDDRGTLAEIIHALTEPAQHVQPYRAGWKYKNRTGAINRTWKTSHASLLDQTRDAIAQRAIVGKYKPTPPGMSDTKTQPHFDHDAHDWLQRIEKETRQWLNHLGIPSTAAKIASTITGNLITITHGIKTAGAMTDTVADAIDTIRAAAADIRASVEPDLRSLLNPPADTPAATLRQLERDAWRWKTGCRVFAGWEIPPAKPRVPCPQCDTEQGPGAGLRVRFDDLSPADTASVRVAVCLSCDAAWDERTIGILERHIRERHPDEQARPAEETPAAATLDDPGKIVHASGRGEGSAHNPPG